jgi:Fe-S cluster assembly protein NifU
MDWVYSEKVKEHFMNPRNILEDENAFDQNGKGLVGNIKCGDQMLMLIRVDPGSQKITDCRWKTYGCASAIASTSVLSEMVIGMTLKEAFAVTPRQIMKQLGDLPEHKVHCSVLGDKALRAAINDYYRKSGREDLVREEKARIVCQCMSVTDLEIENAVLEGARNFLELQEHTKIATVCGQCKGDALNVLKEAVRHHFPESGT